MSTLDGTIYDDPMPGALDALRTLMGSYSMFIHTTRDPDQVVPWLEGQGLNATSDEACKTCHGEGGGQDVDLDYRPMRPAWDCGNCEGSGLLKFWNERGRLLVTSRKLPAVALIDDRAIRFESWDQALADLDRYEGSA